jgi:hypothetical protein
MVANKKKGRQKAHGLAAFDGAQDDVVLLDGLQDDVVL